MLIVFILAVILSIFMIVKVAGYSNSNVRPPIYMYFLPSMCYLTTGILFNLTFLK